MTSKLVRGTVESCSCYVYSSTSLVLVTAVLTMVGLSCQNGSMNCGVMVRVLQTLRDVMEQM